MSDHRGPACFSAPLLGAALALLVACDSTEPPPYTIDPATLERHLEEAIAEFECGYSTFAWVALGHEGVFEPWAGLVSRAHAYRATPGTGACDPGDGSSRWFDQIVGARATLSNVEGTGLYEVMRAEPQSAEIERLSAIAALYVAASLDHFGEFFCETTLDGGDLLTPDEVLGMAEDWITSRALAHIDAHGDFALPNGIASSARAMAVALRARIRWARGDLSGAAADAEAVPEGFTAWITRDNGPTRRNRVYASGASIALSRMLRINDWWTGSANPATGEPWPSPIPFTGYVFLGIAPDGRAVTEQGYAVQWAEDFRDVERQPVPLGDGSVPDTRVPHRDMIVAGPPPPPEVPLRFTSEADDIPLVSWREMWLIRAEATGGQMAIDLVNDLRGAAELPAVTYMTGATATPQRIRYMIIEERRRELFTEGGRFWATKIANPDLLWFPRSEGRTPHQGYDLEGGVRLALPEDEYMTNPHLIARGGLDARGTGCDRVEAPVFP